LPTVEFTRVDARRRASTRLDASEIEQCSIFPALTRVNARQRAQSE
jgi:hypothetical protein